MAVTGLSGIESMLSQMREVVSKAESGLSVGAAPLAPARRLRRRAATFDPSCHGRSERGQRPGQGLRTGRARRLAQRRDGRHAEGQHRLFDGDTGAQQAGRRLQGNLVDGRLRPRDENTARREGASAPSVLARMQRQTPCTPRTPFTALANRPRTGSAEPALPVRSCAPGEAQRFGDLVPIAFSRRQTTCCSQFSWRASRFRKMAPRWLTGGSPVSDTWRGAGSSGSAPGAIIGCPDTG